MQNIQSSLVTNSNFLTDDNVIPQQPSEQWLTITMVSIFVHSFFFKYLNVNICFTHYYLQMILRISNLTKAWKKSLKRYVSLYTFMSSGLMSKTIINMISIIYSVDETHPVVCEGNAEVLVGKIYRRFDTLQRL